MKRYTNTIIRKKDQNNEYGERVGTVNAFRTTLYAPVPESNNDVFAVTQDGDRLDQLAFLYYGDQSYWWFIARTNNLVTMNVPAGTSLRIPSDPAGATDL